MGTSVSPCLPDCLATGDRPIVAPSVTLGTWLMHPSNPDSVDSGLCDTTPPRCGAACSVTAPEAGVFAVFHGTSNGGQRSSKLKIRVNRRSDLPYNGTIWRFDRLLLKLCSDLSLSACFQ